MYRKPLTGVEVEVVADEEKEQRVVKKDNARLMGAKRNLDTARRRPERGGTREETYTTCGYLGDSRAADEGRAPGYIGENG